MREQSVISYQTWLDSTSTTLTYNCRTKRLELGVRLTLRGSLPNVKYIWEYLNQFLIKIVPIFVDLYSILVPEFWGWSPTQFLWKFSFLLIFTEFSLATPPGVWTIPNLWTFEELTNERISQSTNIIFQNHSEETWFAPKHI